MKKSKVTVTLLVTICLVLILGIEALAKSYTIDSENITISAEYNNTLTIKVINRSNKRIRSVSVFVVPFNNGKVELVDDAKSIRILSVGPGETKGTEVDFSALDGLNYAKVYPYSVSYDDGTYWGLLSEGIYDLDTIKSLGTGFRVSNESLIKDSGNGFFSRIIGILLFILRLSLVIIVPLLLFRLIKKRKTKRHDTYEEKDTNADSNIEFTVSMVDKLERNNANDSGVLSSNQISNQAYKPDYANVKRTICGMDLFTYLEFERMLREGDRYYKLALDYGSVDLGKLIEQTNPGIRKATVVNSGVRNPIFEADLKHILLRICYDTQDVITYSEFCNVFSGSYFNVFFDDYIRSVPGLESAARTYHIKRGKSLSVQLSEAFNTVVNDSCSEGEIINNLVEVYSELRYLDGDYNYPMVYFLNVLLTCVCVARLLFIGKLIKGLDKENELYTIISNTFEHFTTEDEVIEQTWPLFEQFYKKELGYISDKALYAYAIRIFKCAIIGPKFAQKDLDIIKYSKEVVNDERSLDNFLASWINSVAKEYDGTDIKKYILYKMFYSISRGNFDLFVDSLNYVDNYVDYYNKTADYFKKVATRDRFLSGDFGQEKDVKSKRYFDILNNIETGTQFELWLFNLFRDLGYDVKHVGGSGDQGADLILFKNNITYAVQAKHYATKLGNTPVQEVVGALNYYVAQQGVVITNNEFTNDAKKLAKVNNVILVDGKGLKKLIECAANGNCDNDILKEFET